jgi:hypothetical protein
MRLACGGFTNAASVQSEVPRLTRSESLITAAGGVEGTSSVNAPLRCEEAGREGSRYGLR